MIKTQARNKDDETYIVLYR